MKLILPESMDAPTIPSSFLSQLKSLDSGLVIYWNRFKNRFVIDRCSQDHTHTAQCERSNVMIVEDEEGGYMTPNDRVLDKIRSMDAWTKFGTLENFRRDHENKKAEYDAKEQQAAKTGYREAMLDDKVQINRFLDLVKRHDMRPHTK